MKYTTCGVVSISKIQIWEQFTTIPSLQDPAYGCCQYFKDTNLRAIHNNFLGSAADKAGVVSISKIQIWEQFTTLAKQQMKQDKVLSVFQRYKFESNSQRRNGRYRDFLRCCQYFKDTNLRAIHNTPPLYVPAFLGVVSISKIQIWEQFTTRREQAMSVIEVLSVFQRYKFESNSQHKLSCLHRLPRCCQYFKDTNLRAIHNGRTKQLSLQLVLSVFQRYKFESNSQRGNIEHRNGVGVVSISKIQIWEQFTTEVARQLDECGCCQYFKDTNLRAIHNKHFLRCFIQLGVVSISKIQIWEQFTTKSHPHIIEGVVLSVFQRYKFESNSQRIKDKSVKKMGVVSISKIQIWEQFTTQ